MSPKVSIIVPVYNTERYLSECMDSIIKQTLKEIEIIIINDCSPDNSIEIIRKYQKEDNRIKVIDKKQNEGVGKARNDGINTAEGEFVIFMDSDDLYSNEYVIEKLYNAAKENNVNVSAGRKETLNENGTIELLDNPIYDNGLSFYQMGLTKYSDFQYDYGYQCYLINRKMIVDHNLFFPRYSRFQDPPFFVKVMFVAKEYFFIEEPVYRYRLLSDSSKFTIKKTFDFICGVMDNMEFAKENNLSKLYYLSVQRLNTEGSFMAIQNLYNENNNILLSKLIEANQAVDVKWIKEKGYNTQDPFVLDVFKYAVNTAEKYEKLRNKTIVTLIRKILGK